MEDPFFFFPFTEFIHEILRDVSRSPPDSVLIEKILILSSNVLFFPWRSPNPIIFGDLDLIQKKHRCLELFAWVPLFDLTSLDKDSHTPILENMDERKKWFTSSLQDPSEFVRVAAVRNLPHFLDSIGIIHLEEFLPVIRFDLFRNVQGSLEKISHSFSRQRFDE